MNQNSAYNETLNHTSISSIIRQMYKNETFSIEEKNTKCQIF